MNSSFGLLKLTERQKHIGICLLEGMSTKEIARVFRLSTSTVRAHQKLIRKKLSCQNAYQVGYKLATLFDLKAEKSNFYD